MKVNYWEKNMRRLGHILLHYTTRTPSVGINYSKRDTTNNIARWDRQVLKYTQRFPEGSHSRVTMDDFFNATSKNLLAIRHNIVTWVLWVLLCTMP